MNALLILLDYNPAQWTNRPIQTRAPLNPFPKTPMMTVQE